MRKQTRRLKHQGLVLAGVAAALMVMRQPTVARGIPDDSAAINHALSRLTYGARPSDPDRVRAMGLQKWIDEQLNPSRIDDAELQRRLTAAPTRPAQFDTPKEAQQFGRQAVQHLAAERVTRAVYSERQLQEVMTDFWFNHFNVFAGKGRTSQFLPDYETDAIRPHVFGSFRELLGATAKSPAMLFYLDNWLSADPEAAKRLDDIANTPRRRAQQADTPQAAAAAQARNRRRGLNENYGRELLELHTLGVDGGYTQKDIVEVARAFTGWTIGRPGQQRQQARVRNRRVLPPQSPQMDSDDAGQFLFTPALHDRGEKVVLGHTIKSDGGIDDGERVLDIVAAHPSTARHIATKLVRRFVSDTPPPSLVEQVAARFRETNGNLREVVRAVITSDEFFAAEARRAKVKTPLEFVVSALRTTGRDLPDPRFALRALQQLGMPMYGCQPPTGYEDTAEAWISAGALVTRMNIAQMLTGPQAETIGGPEFQRR